MQEEVGPSRDPDNATNSARQGFAAPAISLPKGGGAIRGIAEKFAANPVTGTGSTSVPIATSPGRSGLHPQISLSYDSGAGNGPFGFGWSFSLPSITRKTDKGLPRYFETGKDQTDSDEFILSGSEDLVPVLTKDALDDWIIQDTPSPDGNYLVRRYRPRTEGLFARIERWTNVANRHDIHWRSISKENILSIYGKDRSSRIADPSDPDAEHPKRIFSWLICESRDDKGNAIVYDYKPEDDAGLDLTQVNERNRVRTANRYIKRIHYGNREPLLDNEGKRPAFLTDAQTASAAWMFEVVFDYGEHDADAPNPDDGGLWPARNDPFSLYRAGFEVRTHRLCQRVLMFHHFEDEESVGANCLVRSTNFEYSHEQTPDDARNPVYSFLLAVEQSGYKRQAGGYLKRSLPPIEFGYTMPVVQETVEEVDAESLENLPVGLDGSTYRWIDLHGEGIPGILAEQTTAWFYKRNLSPISPRPRNGTEGKTLEAKFSPVEVVAVKPNLGLADGAQFMDLAGDGQPDLVVFDGSVPGLYEHDGDEGWQPFQAFTSRLNRNTQDPNLKFVDLDGDGHADLLITENGAFVWHASLGEAGFGPGQRVAQELNEEKGPRLVFADGTQSVYLADMSGDGLTDLVRIRNGEVCYWPNLGYCRFAAKVTMDSAPRFDGPDEFDQNRIRLADIDGSGTTDIIYLHRGGVRLYFNQSGNSWSEPQTISVFPHSDEMVNVMPVDLLGNGTACLVWSSPSAVDAKRPMRYVNLMGGQKPHLLVKTVNNLGSETLVDYAPSTKFYLQDKRDGKPWISRLPFPVHVVERVEIYDHVSRNRSVTRYAYHHGYFDGDDREFRGFGMVEQWDTEEFGTLNDEGLDAEVTNGDPASHVPPVLTRTWFHTGTYLDRDHISKQFQREYYREPGLTGEEFRALLLADTLLPAEPGLTLDEEREACRALKGSMLRQELYALDGKGVSENYPSGHPYTLAERNFTIRVIQPRANNRHGIFFTHPREVVTYHYERNPADPRIQHAVTLEVDDYGNVLKQAAIGYGRRQTVRVVDENGDLLRTDPNPGLLDLLGPDREKQTKLVVTYTESRVAGTQALDPGDADRRDAIDTENDYRTPAACETRTYELTGFALEVGQSRFSFEDCEEFANLTSDDEIPYERAADLSIKQKRLIEQVRTLYRRDDLGGLLPLGDLEPMALPGDSFKLAFSPGLLQQVFVRDGQALPISADLLSGQGASEGGYVASQTLRGQDVFPQIPGDSFWTTSDADDHWWISTGRVFLSPDRNDSALQERDHARRHFFLPFRYVGPFGQETSVAFDGPADLAAPRYDLLVSQTSDAVGNTVTSVIDYRVLQPRVITDPNGNRTEVAFDAFGMVVGTAAMGKLPPAPVEGDTLDGFVIDLTESDIMAFHDAEDPHVPATGLLAGATTRIIYDLYQFRRTRDENPDDPAKWLPAYAATLARETHVSDLEPGQETNIQISFSYSDGFGREVQKKIQAEPGPLVEGGPTVTGRWVGSGWTIFNNKGKPVRQFEPFFSQLAEKRHQFEFGSKVGVSPILFYDPIERVIATLHPNHTYEKVVSEPWKQIAYDVNDTCAPRTYPAGDPRPSVSGDPRTDPDVVGYVAEYFNALPESPEPWLTWYQQRIDDLTRPHERDAAKKAEAHADTPTTAYFDVLGRPFLTLSSNRVVSTDHTLDGTEHQIVSRVELDIEGNQREVRDAIEQAGDPLGRIVMRYDYDMLGSRIYQASMEAGERWMLDDAAGNPIRAWDSRGHQSTSAYDILRRPIGQYLLGTTADSDPRTLNPPDPAGLLVDKIVYGEPEVGADQAELERAQRLNLRTRIYRHFDSAGTVTNALVDATDEPQRAYDFKGNPLHGTRRLCSDYKIIPDWSAVPDLEPQAYETTTRYDAFNRPIETTTPDGSVHRPTFNEANLLDRVDVDLRGSATTALVTNIDYDAKGQRASIAYGNGAQTTYHYEPLTFRLMQLKTTRPAGLNGLASIFEQPTVVQDLHYTYDPVGNITRIEDRALRTVFHDGQQVEPVCEYTYDAVYRLIEATGREHVGQTAFALSAQDRNYRDYPFFGHRATPNDQQALRRYTQRYEYDAVGNFDVMRHLAVGGAWTRQYDYEEDSLIEAGKQSNRLTRTTVGNGSNHVEAYEHDAHGNMTRMAHLSRMQWSYRDQLQSTSRQVVNNGGTPEITYYVYDSTGVRVRKVTEGQAATGQTARRTKERIYVGGCEIYREYEIGGAAVEMERETLHVMDDEHRIALAETLTVNDSSAVPVPSPLIRYQLGNHLGSAGIELDADGGFISYEEYHPYGTTSLQAMNSSGPSLKRYRHTGKERDRANGLYYHGARYYAAWIARWTSCDPAGLEDSASLFVYVANNPVRNSDPTGGSLWDSVKSSVGGAVNRAEAAVKPGGAVFEAVDSAFNKNESPIAAAVLNNMANRGEEIAVGINQQIKETAEDYADMAYAATHPTETGSAQKFAAASRRRDEAPAKQVVGAVVGFGQMVKRVGVAARDISVTAKDIGYHKITGKGEIDPNAGPKIASAVTDLAMDLPQIISTVAGVGAAAKSVAGGAAVKSAVKPYKGTVPVKGKPQVTKKGDPNQHASTSLEAVYDLGENSAAALNLPKNFASELKVLHLPRKNPGKSSLAKLTESPRGPKGSPQQKIPDGAAITQDGKLTAIEVPSPSESLRVTVSRHLKAQLRGLEEGLFIVPPGYRRP